jgi:hypothetical protein
MHTSIQCGLKEDVVRLHLIFDISHRYMEICSQRFAQPVKFLKATAIINKKLDFASTER